MSSPLLDQADPCPVCDCLPQDTLEPGYEAMRVFLRCPNGHPYVSNGENLLQAVNHWNRYIQLQIQGDTSRMMSLHSVLNASFCRVCQQFTPSITQFEKVGPDLSHLGYSVVKQECVACHLIKSVREAA